MLLSSFAAGGSERAMINFSNGLANRGINVELISGGGSKDFRSLVDESVNVIDLQRGMFRSIPFLRSYLKLEKPDILFSSQLHLSLIHI